MIEPNSTSTTEPQSAPVTEAAKHAWQTTKEKAGDVLHTGERYVREHPTTSALSIFGFGCLIGAVIGWGIAHEAHQSYTDRALKLAKRLGGKFNLD